MIRIAFLDPRVEGSIKIDISVEPEIERKMMIGKNDISPRLSRKTLRALGLKNAHFFNLLLEQKNDIRYDKETDKNVPAFSERITNIDPKRM